MKIIEKSRFFSEIRTKFRKKFDDFLRVFWIGSGAKACESCRSWNMLKNEYLVAKIGFDAEENELSKVWSFSFKNTGFYSSDLSTKVVAPVKAAACSRGYITHAGYNFILAAPRAVFITWGRRGWGGCIGKLWTARSRLYRGRSLQLIF